MLLHKHTGQIASPIASDPSEALAQIFRAVFERRLDFGLLVILHGDLVAMSIHPSSDEVIIVSVQLTSSPLLVCEAVSEFFRLQDITAVCDGSTGETGEAAIDMQTCGAVEVAAFQVSGSQEAPNAYAR